MRKICQIVVIQLTSETVKKTKKFVKLLSEAFKDRR